MIDAWVCRTCGPTGPNGAAARLIGDPAQSGAEATTDGAP
jgi:hypothetical protein